MSIQEAQLNLLRHHRNEDHNLSFEWSGKYRAFGFNQDFVGLATSYIKNPEALLQEVTVLFANKFKNPNSFGFCFGEPFGYWPVNDCAALSIMSTALDNEHENVISWCIRYFKVRHEMYKLFRAKPFMPIGARMDWVNTGHMFWMAELLDWPRMLVRPNIGPEFTNRSSGAAAGILKDSKYSSKLQAILSNATNNFTSKVDYNILNTFGYLFPFIVKESDAGSVLIYYTSFRSYDDFNPLTYIDSSNLVAKHMQYPFNPTHNFYPSGDIKLKDVSNSSANTIRMTYEFGGTTRLRKNNKVIRSEARVAITEHGIPKDIFYTPSKTHIIGDRTKLIHPSGNTPTNPNDDTPTKPPTVPQNKEPENLVILGEEIDRVIVIKKGKK